MKSRPTSGFLKVSGAAVLFSVNPPLFRVIDLGPLELFWTVNLLAVLTLTAYTVWREQSAQIAQGIAQRRWLLAALAAAFTLNNVLFIAAVKTTTVATSVLAHYSAPVFVFVIGLFVLNEVITVRSAGALACAAIGVALLVEAGPLNLGTEHVMGLLLGLGSAVFFAQEIVLKKMLVDDLSGPVIALVSLTASVVALTPFVQWGDIVGVSTQEALLLTVSGVFASGVGISLFTSGLRHVRAQQASVLSYIEPVGAIVWGVVWLGEYPTLGTWIGGALVLCGTLLVVIGPRGREGFAS